MKWLSALSTRKIVYLPLIWFTVLFIQKTQEVFTSGSDITAALPMP